MKWVIQSNLINKEDSESIRNTCVKNGYQYETIEVVPFTQELPDIANDQPIIFYGATCFVTNIYKSKRWTPGVFFDIDNFTITSYVEHYEKNMFNFPCEFTTIGKFASSGHSWDKHFFIRPIKDLKEFSGEVMTFEKLVRWDKNIRHLPGYDNNPTLTSDTGIAVSEPFNIADEWRVFVVGGKASSGSHYRSYMSLKVEPGIPDRVKNFVEKMCKIWVPADVFVMDVGESAGNLFIIECNCFNSSGFYKSDIDKIIITVSEYVINGRKPNIG
jgi:hypothetical protein